MKKVLVMLLAIYSFAFGLEDMLGRNVDVRNYQKLVFVGPGALRLGTYVGAEKYLVGVERIEQRGAKLTPYRAFLKKRKKTSLPIIGEGGAGKVPSMEALIKSKATLIISSFIDKTQANLIEQKTKIPVFVVSYGSGYGGEMEKLASIKKSLKLIAKIIKNEKRAHDLIKNIENEEKKLSKLKLSNKSVYVGGIGYKGAWGLESTESNYLPFSLLDANTALKTEKSGHLFLDLERVVKLNPDIIFIDQFGFKKFKEQEKKKKVVFQNMKAFKNKNVYKVPAFNFYNTNLENSLLSAWIVAKALGADVDIEKEKKRIFDIFFEK